MTMMLSRSHRDCVRTYGTLLGRILIGLLFFFSGIGILMMGPENTAGFYEDLGIPMAGLMVWLVVAVKLVAGGALMAGYRTGLASATLIGFTLVATVLAHLDLEDPNLFKNLAIIGGLLYTMAYGAGDGWSVDGGSDDVVTIPDSADQM